MAEFKSIHQVANVWYDNVYTTAADRKTPYQIVNDRYASVDDMAFAATGTQGAAVHLDGRAPIRLLIPSDWSSTAAIVHFDVSETGTSYVPLWVGGTAHTVAVQADQAVRLDPHNFWGVGYVKLIGTQARGTAVAQTTACTVSVVSRLI